MRSPAFVARAVSGAAAPVNTVAPAISGILVNSNTLTVSNGTWTGSPSSYDYSWFADTNPVGANQNTYLIEGVSGTDIYCEVTATNGSGSTPQNSNTITTGSSPTATVAPALDNTSPIVTQTISTDNGTWDMTIHSYAYQWRRDLTPIGGATSNSYTVAVGDIGTVLDCLVTATNNTYGPGEADSNDTDTIL